MRQFIHRSCFSASVSGYLFCSFDWVMFPCFSMCFFYFQSLQTDFVWRKDVHSSEHLEILGASQAFSGDIFSLGFYGNLPIRGLLLSVFEAHNLLLSLVSVLLKTLWSYSKLLCSFFSTAPWGIQSMLVLSMF